MHTHPSSNRRKSLSGIQRHSVFAGSPFFQKKLGFALCLTLIFLLATTWSAEAQKRKRRGKRKLVTQSRSLNDNLNLLSENAFDLDIPSTANNIFENSADTDLYDPLTIDNLKRLQEDAQPYWNPDEIDPVITRRVAEKALAIQTGQTVSALAKRSELRDLYRDAKNSLNSIRSAFRYKLMDGSEGLTISKTSKGTSLLELDLQFNASKGVDPQIKIGEFMRFRYDYVDKRPMLEYGLNF